MQKKFQEVHKYNLHEHGGQRTYIHFWQFNCSSNISIFPFKDVNNDMNMY